MAKEQEAELGPKERNREAAESRSKKLLFLRETEGWQQVLRPWFRQQLYQARRDLVFKVDANDVAAVAKLQARGQVLEELWQKFEDGATMEIKV